MKARSLVLLLAVGLLLWVASSAGQDARAGRPPRSLWEHAPEAARSRRNPYAGNPDAYRAGQNLFRRHCSACHAEDSRGTRWAPALRTSRLRMAPPGALAWFLKNGDLRAGMPSWSQLPEQRRWQLVTYIQEWR